MADIYLDTLTYYKPETDELIATEEARTDAALLLKSDKIHEGAASGIATLDVIGKTVVTQIPFAEVGEAMDADEITKIVNPKRLHYVIGQTAVTIDSIGALEGVCPLNASGKVAATYLEPTGTVSIYVRETLDERNVIPGVLEGDRCYVTNDPSDTGGDVNGQYLAQVDDPAFNEWTLLPNLDAVSSVNGQVGVVEITSISESVSNAADITALDIRVTDSEIDIAVLQPISDTQTSDIAAHDTRISTNEADVIRLNTHVMCDSKNLLVNVDDITDVGCYSVSVNLPGTGNTTGTLTIQYISDNAVTGDKQQRLTELQDGKEYTRLDTFNSWGVWVEESLSARITYNQTEMTYDYSNVADYPVVGDVYENVNTLDLSRIAGTYQLSLSMIHTLDSANSSAYFQFRITDSGGPGPWTEIRREPNDNTDKIPLTYFKPFTHAGGTLKVEVEARKENINDTLVVAYTSIVVERKV